MLDEFVLSGENFHKVMGFVSRTTDGRNFMGDQWNGPLEFIPNTIRLKQTRGGPCGLYAVLQAYILKARMENMLSPHELLITAVLDIMDKIRSNTYVFCQLYDLKMERIVIYGVNEREAAANYLRQSGLLYTNIALKLLMISFCFVLGPAMMSTSVTREPFVSERDQYTSLQFVYFMLTGKVIDEPNDGYQCEHGGLISRGCETQQDIGFIRSHPTENDVKVGRNLGCPKKDIWVVHNGGHFYAVMRGQDNQIRKYDSLAGGEKEFELASAEVCRIIQQYDQMGRDSANA